MKLKYTLATALLLALNPVFTSASEAPHWTYEGKAGPDHWSEISEDFATCHKGKFQSPIDIRSTVDAKLPPLNLHYRNSAETLVNNGHTIQVTVDEKDEIQLDGKEFLLKQYHFHAPSENLINGKSFPLEAHFVHDSEDDELAVVAVMFEIGAENKTLNTILDAIPAEENKVVTINKPMDLRPLFPENLHYYRFSGSLTTPPCSEGLRWLVMKDTVTLSQAQLTQFQSALKHANNRPIQPLHGRQVVE